MVGLPSYNTNLVAKLLLETKTGEPPDPFVKRTQLAKSIHEGKFFLKQLVNCRGAWIQVWTRDFKKASKEGRPTMEQKYKLEGRWVNIGEFDNRVSKRDLKRWGGLEALVGRNLEPGLYAFVELKHLEHPIDGSYYEFLWLTLLLDDKGEAGEIPKDMVSTLQQKPKIVFADELYIP